MKRLRPAILMLLAAVPFCLELPYCLQAMRSAPPEHWNWCFLLAAVALACFAVPRLRREGAKPSPWSAWRLLPLLAGLLLALVGWFRHIHYLALLGGILLPWSMALCLYGWQSAAALLPTAGMLLLFLPNTGYLLSILLPGNGLLLKTIAAAGLAALAAALHWRRKPLAPPENCLFWSTAALIAAGYLVSNQPVTPGPPLNPDFTPLLAGGFRGVAEEPTPQDEQFYGKSAIQRFLYASTDGVPIYVLAVGDIDNIHQVHPVAFCLRASGYRILSERTARWCPDDLPGKAWEIREILAERWGERQLFWQWYSTPHKSTANFLVFRAAYHDADGWTAFLVSTPVASTHEESQRRLDSFVRAFLPATLME
ncbi:MAG: exosortase-associated EpsI family protein [Victivallales bacterium]|nr:exosortase-associated EpsI family protein [Victivallales bacterium]